MKLKKVNNTTGFITKELFEIYDDNLDAHTLTNNKPCNLCKDYF